MTLPANYLDAIDGVRDPSSGPLIMPWPMPGNPGSFLSFATFSEWRGFVLQFSLGLTEDQVPMNRRCGPPSKVLGLLTGETKPNLADIRNDLAHGAPFGGFPWAGLLELVRDLIDYAYRDRERSHIDNAILKG